MRESDLRVLFKRQAASELPPAPISIPVARRIGRARLFRRRAGAFGSPVLAAAAVLAVVLLAGVFAAGQRQPTSTGGPAAPKLFNPLVPYAAATWYPYTPSVEGSADWHTALLLRASSSSPPDSTEVVLYASGWCTLRSASLSCGSTAAGTKVDMTVTGRAPDVQGQPAYWTRYAGGNLMPLRPHTSRTPIVAFQYAPGGWAVVESTGTGADVLKIAASVRYGQTTRVRFPFQLTGLPREWSEVLYVSFRQAVPPVHGPTEDEVVLGSPATRPGTAPHDTLAVIASTMTTGRPQCRAAPVGHPRSSRPVACLSAVINGYRVFTSHPSGQQTVTVPDADGLYLYEQTIAHPPLSPSAIFAYHLKLLGPDAANWTTTPSSGETVKLDYP